MEFHWEKRKNKNQFTFDTTRESLDIIKQIARNFQQRTWTSLQKIKLKTQFNLLFNIDTTPSRDKTLQYHPSFRTTRHWQLKLNPTFFRRVEFMNLRSFSTTWIHKHLKISSILIIENTKVPSFTSIPTFRYRIHLFPINQPTKPWIEFKQRRPANAKTKRKKGKSIGQWNKGKRQWAEMKKLIRKTKTQKDKAIEDWEADHEKYWCANRIYNNRKSFSACPHRPPSFRLCFGHRSQFCYCSPRSSSRPPLTIRRCGPDKTAS